MSIILRYSNTHRGGMLLIGNCGNISDSLYSTSDVLNIPEDSIVKCSELGWYDSNNPNEINFTTPDSSNTIVYEHLENSDGNDWKGANVTSLVNIGKSGSYTVTFQANSNPSWFLLTVYENINLPFRHFKIYSGSAFNTWYLKASKFLTPILGKVNGSLLYGFSRGEFNESSILSLENTQVSAYSLPIQCNLCNYDISDYLTNGQTQLNLYQSDQINTLNVLGLQVDSIYTDLSIVKTVDKSLANSGEILSYNVTITNNGPSSLINAILKDTIPSGATLVEDSLSINGIKVPSTTSLDALTLDKISLGEVVKISFDLLINSNCENNKLYSLSKVSYQLETSDSPTFISESNTVLTEVIPIPSFITSYYKNNVSYAQFGDVIKNTIVISNTGPESALNTLFNLNLSSGVSLVENYIKINGIKTPIVKSNEPIELGNIDSLTGVITINFSLDVIASIGVVESNFTLLYEAKTLPSSRLSYKSCTNLITIPNIIIEHVKHPSTASIFIKQPLTNTILISNKGNVPCGGVLSDAISEPLILIENTLSQDGLPITEYSKTENDMISFTLPKNIMPNTSTCITYSVYVISIPSPNPIKTTSLFNAQYLIMDETLPIIKKEVMSHSNEGEVTILYADLRGLRKFPSKNYAIKGEYLDYTIVGTNTGNYPAKNLFIRDAIQPQLCFVVDSVYVNGLLWKGANPLLGLTIPAVNANETLTISYSTQAL